MSTPALLVALSEKGTWDVSFDANDGIASSFCYLFLLLRFFPSMPVYWGWKNKDRMKLYNFSSDVEVRFEWAESLSLTFNVKKRPLLHPWQLE